MEPQPIVPEASAVIAPTGTEEPAKLESLGAPGCTLDMPRSAANAPLRLRVKRNGVADGASSSDRAGSDPAVLTVRGASAKLGLPLGPAGEALVSAESVSAVIEGFVAHGEIPLYVRPSHKLAGGVLTATSSTRVELLTVAEGTTQVHLATSKLLQLSESATNESVACSDLGAAPFGRPEPADGKPVSLDAKKGLEVRASPEGSPVATLHVPDATVDLPLEATKIQVKGAFALVEIPGKDGIIRGWVPTTQVHARAKAVAGLLGALGPANSELPKGDSPVKSAGFECKASIAFAAPERVGALDHLVWVGTLRAESVVMTDDDPKHAAPSESWRPIRIRDVSANVPLFVRAEALAACMKRL